MIRRRLAPLSADAVGVLLAAAVVGREFDLALLGPACELPAERVLDGLAEAAALGVVAEEPGTAGVYRFSLRLLGRRTTRPEGGVVHGRGDPGKRRSHQDHGECHQPSRHRRSTDVQQDSA